MNDAEQALYLRRLRFPKDLERAFRDDYFRKSAGYGRFLVVIMLLLQTGFLVGDLAASVEPVWSLRWRLGVAIPFLLGALILSFSPLFQRFFQLAIGLAALILGSGVISAVALAAPSPSDTRAHAALVLFAFRLAVVIMAVYTLSRLLFVVAVLVGWILLVAAGVMALHAFHAPTALLMEATVLVLMTNLFGTIACYAMERYLRSDFLAHRLLEEERRKSENLLLGILPAPVAARLKAGSGAIADSFAEVTVLFADIVDFTPLAARLSAGEVVALLNEVFSLFDRLAEEHGLEKIKTIGDAYMVVGGLPLPDENHVEAIAEMALKMRTEIARLSAQKDLPLRLRIGINTGPVVAGVIGTRKFIYDLWGDTVNLASRMESHGLEDCIQVTHAIHERLKDQYRFEERSAVQIKGKGEMVTYLLQARKEELSAREQAAVGLPPK